MGQDFIRNAAPGFQRSWRKGKAKLDQRDLFNDQVKERRTVLADPVPGAALAAGQEYIVRASSGSLTLHRGEMLVAKAKCDESIQAAIRRRGGFATGVAVKVHGLTGTADIEVK